MTEDINSYISPSIIVEVVKEENSIRKPNSEMSDGEIAKVMKFIGYGAPDTFSVDLELHLGRIGIGAMLSLTLYEFPEFYIRHELWQRN